MRHRARRQRTIRVHRVTKETIKLRLISNLANEKQQMPPVRFALHNVNVERIAEVRGYAEFKELAVSIAADIEGVIRRIYPLTITLAPSRRNLTHVEPGADLGKPGFNVFRIHMFQYLVSVRTSSGERQTLISQSAEFG